MEKKKENKPKEKRVPTMWTNSEEVIKYIEKIKAAGGNRRLNKLGEWLAGNPKPLLTWDEKDLKYILR